MEPIQPDTQVLIQAVTSRMPYGKYKGTLICDLPVHYLEWLYSKGLPPGKLGMQLGTVYEMKTNGLNTILMSIKAKVHTR
ncbi:DUF3820 family protein [Mucilaginibacter koreensis]